MGLFPVTQRGYALSSLCQATTEVIHKGTHGVMGKILEVGRCDGLRRHDMQIKF
jgi:hypothetical protein